MFIKRRLTFRIKNGRIDHKITEQYRKGDIQININSIFEEYRKVEEKNIIVTDPNGNLLYKSERMDIQTDIILDKIRSLDYDFDEQEFFDKENDIYINIRRTVVEMDSEQFYCYRVTDVSEYAKLIQEVASYSKSVSNISRFQSSIMKRLSMAYDTFLPGLADYCYAEEAVMLINRKGKIHASFYKNELVRSISELSGKYAEYLKLKRGGTADGFICILSSVIQNSECVVLVKKNKAEVGVNIMDSSIHNVIRLFIENSMLREKIVYESEHDKLTGLYNKGKYMALKNAVFGKPESIAIFNFDVNNLKHINDNYGHEYGDALIIKAAKSIDAVTSENVYGFRMGGDEYVMVAVNVSPEEVRQIQSGWKAALDRLNEEDKELFCSMACGVAYGSGDYDYDELYEHADKLMYENKKALKADNITSHIVS